MAVTKDESWGKIREKANREYQRVQSVKKLSGTYNPVEREKSQREYRDALVALDNEAIGYRKNAALAQKEYDDYVNSQEFQQRKREAATKLTRNTPMSEVPRNAPQMTEVFEDETSKGLKAKADYWKNEQEKAITTRMRQQDMAKVNALPEEDRKLLADYVENKDISENFWAHFGSGGSSLLAATRMDKASQPLVDKYGRDAFDAMVAAYSWDLHERQAEEKMAKAAEDVSTVPGAIGKSIESVGGKLLNTPNAFMGRVGELISPKRYPTLEPVRSNDLASIYYDAVREETGKNIVGEGDNVVRNALGYGYQAAMSTADSLTRLAVLGPTASLGAVAMDSFASGVREATQKGATPAQAYGMGTVNAILEVLTEKVSMDKLLDKAKAGATKDLTKFLLNTIGQAGVEISEEEASLVGSTLAEAAILQEKSEYNRAIQQLVVDGYSYADAKAAAAKAIVDEAKETAFVSGLSGGLSGLTATVYSNAVARAEAKMNASQNAQEAAENPQVGISPETSNDTTKAQSPDVEAAGTPQAGNALTNALGKLAETGNVSNKTVEKILSDPAAMEQLSRQTGIDLSQMATASEKRNAVKAAVRQMAGDAAPTTLNREGAQSLIEDMGQELAERAPARQETPEVTPERQAVQNAFDRVLGVDTGTDLGTNRVDTQTQPEYTGKRSQQVQSAIDRLNSGGTDAPGIDEIMSIPEIAAAERANDGPETITLPNRQAIQDEAYRQAIQKGSWDGQDYNGEVRHDKRMDIVIGLPGSGKSSVYTERLSQEYKSRVIDTDDFRGYIPEYNGSNASMVHREASRIRNRLLNSALDNGDNILLSTIGADAQKLAAQIQKYKDEGYSVYLHLNELPNSKSLARAVGRYISEDGSLGRYVSPRLIAEYGDKPTQTYLYLTGQGGIDNGGLESNLRQSGGRITGNAESTGGAPQSQTAGREAGLLAGYDWYNNDVERGQAPRLIQSSEQNQSSPQVVDSSGKSTEGGQAVDTVGMQNEPSGDLEVSRTVSNTGLHSKDADIRQGYKQMVKENPDAGIYDVKHNADTTATAKERTSTPEKVQAEYDYLMGKDAWTAEDLLTAKYVTKNLVHSEIDGAQNQITEMNMKIREIGTNAGQVTQAFAISGTMADLQDSMTAAQRARNAILDMKREDSTFRQKEGGETYKQWQKDIAKNIDRIAIAVELVDDGDSAGMRDIIRQIARERNTTAWFGTSQNLTGTAERILGKMDFDDLKTVANAQIAAMSDDFRARTKTEIAMGIRKQNMLASLKTFARNITGNSFGGLMDSASDSTGGRMMDAVLSKFTGRKTVGNDFKNVKAYAKGAADAASFASLCVELNIPIETGAGASLSTAMGDGGSGKYMGRTFRSTGNVAMRAMYAFQKYMSYNLEVTDKIFEGGTNAAISESLNNLKNANLTEEQIAQLSEFTANRRTFKDATWKDSDGKTRGSDLSRAAAGFKRGAGDIFGKPGEVAVDAVIPFASVPMNVTQTGIDYSTGVVKSVGEAISLIKDAKAGKEIDVARQRQVASDFGRGLSGVGMIAMFTAAAATGVVKVNEPKDKDEKALLQAEGRSGAQINWSALKRGLDGGSSEWQDGDIITSLDFLEPFNTQLYLGYELSKEGSVADMLKAYPFATVKSVFNSLMDSPMMTGLSGGVDLISGVVEADDASGIMDELAGYAGDTAGSFIPQFVRQTAQLTDGYYRDTRGETSAEYAINNIIAGLPFLSQTLPKKYSGLGEAQERGGFFNTFVDPTKTQTYRKNDVTNYLEELSGSLDGDTSFIPDRQAPMSIHVNGETVNLDGEARETYQKTYGELVSSYYTGLMGSEAFRNLSDEQKANALNRAKTYATEHARAAVSDYTTDSPKDAKTVENSIMQDLVRSEFSKAFDTMEPDALGQAYSIYESLGNAQKQEFKNGTGGRIGYYITARENGVSGETFASLYGVYKNLDDNSGMAGKDKAQEWARTLGNAYESGQITKAAHDALKDKMVFRQTFSIETEKFDAMTESGLSSDVADRIIKGLADLQGTGSVDKDTGEATVTNRDKWGYIAALDGLSDKEKDRVMLLYMPDYDPEAEKPNKTELKYAYLRGRGYSAEQFTQTYGVTQAFTRKADMIAAWVALGYSSEEAQMFYKLYKGKLV